VGIVGEIVVQFWERANWCSRLKADGQEICDNVLGPAGDPNRLVAQLEEAIGRPRVMRGEQGGLEGSASRACAPVLGATGEVPPLAVELSPSQSPELAEARVDAEAINGDQWGPRLALTVTLSHFPKLEVELDLLGSSYNANRSSDEIETLWAWTYWASESLSLCVPPLVTRSPPDSVREK
jgi:hypothetical protein